MDFWFWILGFELWVWGQDLFLDVEEELVNIVVGPLFELLHARLHVRQQLRFRDFPRQQRLLVPAKGHRFSVVSTRGRVFQRGSGVVSKTSTERSRLSRADQSRAARRFDIRIVVPGANRKRGQFEVRRIVLCYGKVKMMPDICEHRLLGIQPRV